MMCLTVDPGITGTGWAMWTPNMRLLKWGNIYPEKFWPWEKRMVYIADSLNKVCKDLVDINNFDCVICVELPSFFETQKGRTAARKNDLVKLTGSAFYILGLLNRYTFKLVSVSDWKGQLPKSAVEERIKKIYPHVSAKDHALDAIGIGLYLRKEKLFR